MVRNRPDLRRASPVPETLAPSDVRASTRARLRHSDLYEIHQARSLQEILAAFAASASVLASGRRTFVVVKSTGSRGTVAAALQNQIEARLDENPELVSRLARGERVLLNPGNPEDLASSLPFFFLLPVAHGNELIALLCVALARAGSQLSDREVELLQALCREAAPVLARTRDREGGDRRRAELPALALAAPPSSPDARFLSHLLSNVSHELRTPLTAIRGYTKLILDDRAGALNSTQREYLSIVFANIAKMVDIANRLTATRSLQLQTVDLRKLLEQAIQQNRDRVSARPVRMRGADEESFLVRGDPAKLAFALEQLLLHALQHASPSCELSAECRRSEPESIVLRIYFDAVGLSGEWMRKLMDRDTDTDPGLSIAHEIVYLHGGRISIESRLGEGAAFTLSLPAVQSAT
jgi:signal transduction histidine kinase